MNEIKNLSIFIIAFSVLMIGAPAAASLDFNSPVFATTEQSDTDESNNDESNNDESNNDESNNDESNNDESNNDESNNNQSNSTQTDNEQPTLETVDTHLENCIQQIENDNTDEALNDCQNADSELDRLIANATG